MKDLNKSLALLNDFFENASKEEIHRMMKKVNAMFTSDITFVDYFSLMNSAYDFPGSIFSAIEYKYKTAVFQCIPNIKNEKCTIGADILPVQIEGDTSYTKEYYYNLAA